MEGIFLQAARRLVLVVIVVSIVSAQPVLLTDSLSTDVSEFVAVSGGRVVYINTHGKLSSVNKDDPLNTEDFIPDWTPASDGWAGDGQYLMLRAGADGNIIMAAVQVSLPDSLLDTGIAMPDPVVIMVCNSSGGDARAVGVTYRSNEELCFDFTQDSRLLYGAGFLNCQPDPVSYYAKYLGDQSSLIRPFDMVDLVEGSRFSTHGVVGSHFLCNPWSDLIAAGDDGEPLTRIANMVNFSVLYEDSTLSESVIDMWTGSESGLAGTDTGQVCRFSDGSVLENPGTTVTVFCSLSNGKCVYSVNGEDPVYWGRINWQTFEVEESTELVELAGYFSPGHTIQPVGRYPAVIFNAGRGLYYYELR
jgi:hypothetical protein